jgi:hypothetical protein
MIVEMHSIINCCKSIPPSFGSGQYADPGGTDRAAQPIHGGRQREIVRGVLATAVRIPDHPHGA